MDPTRLTLYSSVGGVLLAALVLGPVFIMAIMDYEGEDDPLQEGSMSRPAAQEAFARGLQAEDAAYLNDRFEMTMEVIGTDDLLLGEAMVRADPDKGDIQFIMAFDLKAMEEAYGTGDDDDTNGTSDALVNETLDMDGDLDLFSGIFFGSDQEEWERFEVSFASIGEEQALAFGPGTGISWRDYSPKDSPTLFDEDEEDDEDSFQASEEPEPGFGGEELARFIEADESLSVHEVEESEWEGTPSWKITTTVQEDGFEEEAVFHFRQSDMAPLAIDMFLDGASENGFFGMLEEEEEFDVEALQEIQLHMKMRFRYGNSVRFDPIEGYTRLPVSPVTDDERGSDRIVRNLTDAHEQTVPLDDLELHFVVLEDNDAEDPFASPELSQTLGVLRLKDAHEIETDDHRIVYEDNDDDGRLSSGDRFYVETTDEDGIWSNQTHSVQLLVYDTWAGELEGAPAPAVAWILALAMAGIGLMRRRRSRIRQTRETH